MKCEFTAVAESPDVTPDPSHPAAMVAGSMMGLVQATVRGTEFAVEVSAGHFGDAVGGAVVPHPLPPLHPLIPKLFRVAEQTPHYTLLRPKHPGTLINYQHREARAALRSLTGACFAQYLFDDRGFLFRGGLIVPTPSFVVESDTWPAVSVHSVPWGRTIEGQRSGACKRVRMHYGNRIDPRLHIYGHAVHADSAWVAALFPRGVPMTLSPNHFVRHVPPARL